MKKLSLPVLLFLCLTSCGQKVSYSEEIAAYRQQYKQEFLDDERSPLSAKDTAYLRFYPADSSYVFNAHFTLTPDAKPFDMPTVSGKTKKYRQFGTVTFKVNDTTVQLQVLQSQKLIKDPKYKDHLFIPFTDATTYTETYGGGRYLDLLKTDISNNKVVIDFNRCYNPWCAYGDGYSCPIPPIENRLSVAIRAGEKNYGKDVNSEHH